MHRSDISWARRSECQLAGVLETWLERRLERLWDVESVVWWADWSEHPWAQYSVLWLESWLAVTAKEKCILYKICREK